MKAGMLLNGEWVPSSGMVIRYESAFLKAVSHVLISDVMLVVTVSKNESKGNSKFFPVMSLFRSGGWCHPAHWGWLRCLLVKCISGLSASKKDISNTLKELVMLVTSVYTSVLSFELLWSSVIDGLLQFATNKSKNSTWDLRLLSVHIFNWFALVSIAWCQELLLDTFAACKSKALAGLQTPSPFSWRNYKRAWWAATWLSIQVKRTMGSQTIAITEQ